MTLAMSSDPKQVSSECGLLGSLHVGPQQAESVANNREIQRAFSESTANKASLPFDSL